MSKKIFFIIIIAFCLIMGYFHVNPPLSESNLQQTEQCFLDGQIPCRWLMDANQGLGFPVFNYISPLPYYFSLIPRLFGLNHSLSLILITLIISLISYKLLKKIIPTNPIISILIIALSFFTSSIFPLSLLLLFLYYLDKNFYLTSLSLALLLISVSNIFIIPTLITCLFLILFLKPDQLKKFFLLSIFAILLSSFYIGPALTSLYQDTLNLSQNTITFPQVNDGEARLSEFKKRSNFWRLTVNAATESHALIPVSYHPSWTILIDQKPTIALNDTLYQPTLITIPPGQHTIVAFLQNSTSTTIFNLISLFSIIYLFVASFPKNVQKNSKS